MKEDHFTFIIKAVSQVDLRYAMGVSMQRIVNSAQMKEIDNKTIEKIGLPAMVLMERAALQVADFIVKHINMKDNILVVCGIGNNGADGIATARILKLAGYIVDVLLVGDEEKATEQAKQQFKIARNLNLSVYNNIDIDEYTIIVDAIFGVGLNRQVKDSFENIINKINQGNHKVFSIDIPSGLSTDTAKPMNVAVKADFTITFGLYKLGLMLYPGCEYAGEVILVDIGFPECVIDEVKTGYFTYLPEDLYKLPARKAYSNKGTYGKVLVIAGNVNMGGACYLSAKASYRTGSGLVKVVTPKENRVILQTLLPEAILSTYNHDSLNKLDIDRIISDIKWANVIVFGPGIGISLVSEKIMDLVVQNAEVPVIIDADGINILSSKFHDAIPSQHNKTNDNYMELLSSYLPKETILTPHLKELSRLSHRSLEVISNNLIETADIFTSNNDLILAMKDARTIVAYKNMRYINTSGNNGMATAGSGDVLTGIVASLIAQGMSSFDAVTLGVYIHGLAGDKAAKDKGRYSLMASDIIEALAYVLNT